MSQVSESEADAFFADVNAASRKAIWCALATASPDGPRVRMVHPTWEDRVLWFATSTGSAKVEQLRRDPRVDIQFQVSPPDFVHVMVRGLAELIDDPGEKRRVWEVIDYDLAQFWPGGPEDPEFQPVKIAPDRVEHSTMFGSQNRRVWRRRPS